MAEDKPLEIKKSDEKSLSGIFSQFNKPFWVVNSFELFERGAYYGTMAVLGVHVTYYILKNDPSAAAIWGLLYSMLIIILYFFPLISAALAEKFGYRQVLFVCYGMMLIGYFSLAMVKPGQFGFLIFSFIMVGFGAGAFKPIISATIAQVTKVYQRNLAYSIYYWMINLGALLVPCSIGLYTFFKFGGIEDNIIASWGIYYFVYALSGTLIIINTLILIFLFRNPIEPKKELSIFQSLQRITPAFKDRKFVILLVIYAGFWFMFAYNHTFLPVYMVDYSRMPMWFVLPFLATINPGTIVILGPFLGKYVEKYKSLNIMMTGIVIFCIGLAINGFSNTPALFVLGIIVFSIGEFITHPGFISYVSKIAPKDKLTIYMGAIFISTGLGNAVGGAVQGAWYNYYARTLFMPKVYVSLVIVVGLITLLSFMLYNRWLESEKLRREPTTVVDYGIWTKPVTAGVVLLFIPITVYGAYLGGANFFYGSDTTEDVLILDWSEDYEEGWGDIIRDGTSNENSETEIRFELHRDNISNLKRIKFELLWTDETPTNTHRYTNEPDNFQLSINPPDDAATIETDHISSGHISIEYDPLKNETAPNKDPYFFGTGEYVVLIRCHECGDHTPIVEGLGSRNIQDTGNDWTFQVTYYYWQKKSEVA